MQTSQARSLGRRAGAFTAALLMTAVGVGGQLTIANRYCSEPHVEVTARKASSPVAAAARPVPVSIKRT